jgi:hypothetical protein
VDASAQALSRARELNAFDEYVQTDVLEWLREQVTSGTHYDAIVASHLIEHLPRERGEHFLRLVELLNPRLVYIETPRGFVEPAYLKEPRLHAHLSGWFPWDFEARGYTVFGMGLAGLRGGADLLWCRCEFITRSLERGLQWMCYRRPYLAATIAAIRYIDHAGLLRRL